MRFFGAPRYKGRYKMAVPMTSLSRANNGDWFARKGIPKDVREAYKLAYWVAQEERFRRPGSLSTGAAKGHAGHELNERVDRIASKEALADHRTLL